MAESGIETAAAPEWLVKLESRREQIKAKLGHESGNGAPCVACGTKCPGLDLHFWRKVCRNCKCRKEQHDCKDDDVTGWAQFEILGAIRSKPAYIKISELTDKPVQLDWIPPNVTPELASDYMTQLGKQNIPIAGSEAAEKRKQQLEYQVPPHDLDASLCHNLSENEEAQLVQYVEKIKKNCVGQGSVVRIGDGVNYLPPSGRGHAGLPHATNTSIQKDKVLSQLLGSETIQNIISGNSVPLGRPLCISKETLKADFIESPLMSDKTKYKLKLMKIDSEAMQSAVLNGPEIDRIIAGINEKAIPFQENCGLLGPLEKFRQEYKNNPKFQTEIDNFISTLPTQDSSSTKEHNQDHSFNSPLPLRNLSRQDQLQHQETPARKLNFEDKPNIPLSSQCRNALKQDKVLADIMNSEPLKAVLQGPVYGKTLIISRKPLFPDFISSPFLSPATKTRLERMKINTQTIQSAVLNGPFYDELLTKLDKSSINYAQDSILQPIDEFRDEFLSYDSDSDFQKEIIDFVKNSDLSQFDVTPDQIPEVAENRRDAQRTNALLNQITSIPTVQNALKFGVQPGHVLQVFNEPMHLDLQYPEKLSKPVLEKLASINLNSSAIESAVVCGPAYDKILHQLNKNRINYAFDSVVGPIAQFRNEYLGDDGFRKELARYIAHPEPCLFQNLIATEELPTGAMSDAQIEQLQQLSGKLSGLHVSQSADSGFGSVPPTPNYSTYPGLLSSTNEETGYDINRAQLTAHEGKLVSIPAIQDMNMYPEVRPSKGSIGQLSSNDSVALPSTAKAVHPKSLLKTPEFINCGGCQKSIMCGEVAVKAERAGKSAWHPQCFKCHKCEELLADLVYFYHGGNVYCARDLAEILKIPRCSACDELIFTKEYTAAEGATFHIKHFCCYHCDAPLAGQQYVPDEKSNMPLCLNCYDTYFAKTCHRCRGSIGPAEQGVAWGNIHWHGSCFLCSGVDCGKSLIGGRFCVKNEMPFCSPQCLRSVIA
ncbi:uncharacterized protein LOC129748525 [Uranotaenia lowii]|uniref:uncharacterized protein LOC129748525 n=1 Tax=Uranotaenia lowii TaxID=190385 RepID=UPI00247A9273|nr:uncharacterized protein LOC129748525 [Uranotaenia lowii]